MNTRAPVLPERRSSEGKAAGRLDASAGTQLPTTLWPTAILGLDVRPCRGFSFGIGGGYAGYSNELDQLGISGFTRRRLRSSST